MTCEEHDNTYNLGQFHALLFSLSTATMSPASLARRSYAAAMRIKITQADADVMLDTAREMEEAARTLREAAATAQPAIRLMAAE